MSLTNIKYVEKNYNNINEDIIINGWIKTNRDNGDLGFISFNDGTSLASIQIVYKNNITINFDKAKNLRTGSAIQIIGKIILTPEGKQPYEILASEIILLSQASEDFPLQKKKHSNEFLREIAHLRPRTNLFNAIMRVRSEIYNMINTFFYQKDFTWVTTPVFTSNDAEGAGECFQIKEVDKENFFNSEASLSVTGQLHAEAYAMAFQKVFTFGPQFRAEKSHTNRHAAEFWMLEPEIAFYDINDLMILIEEMIKWIINEYLVKCTSEIKLFNEFVDTTLLDKLNNVINNNFAKIEYSNAIEILNEAIKNGIKFENTNIKFGMDLDSEHERYICEKIYNKPTFVFNYPKEIKAFYMKINDDNKTVAGVDLLVPGIGELCGGSQRESNYETLKEKALDANMKLEDLQWYLDLRKYGYYKSSGFGLGFERLIMYITGVNNIRDTIPFPRTHANIKF